MQIASRQPLWSEGVGKGTVLVVRTSDASMTVYVMGGSLAPGSAEAKISWGDGTTETVRNPQSLRHTYSAKKEYKIVISDDLSSFGFTDEYTDEKRQMLAEVLSVGRKVMSIPFAGFNNCRSMRGKIEFPSVTSIGTYAFGSLGGVTELSFPSLTRLTQTSFYAGCGPRTMYADNVTQIDSQFWEYYGSRLVDLYIRKKTCEQIKAMSGFPFRAGAAVRFHGSDGIVTGDGRITLG